MTHQQFKLYPHSNIGTIKEIGTTKVPKDDTSRCNLENLYCKCTCSNSALELHYHINAMKRYFQAVFRISTVLTKSIGMEIP